MVRFFSSREWLRSCARAKTSASWCGWKHPSRARLVRPARWTRQRLFEGPRVGSRGACPKACARRGARPGAKNAPSRISHAGRLDAAGTSTDGSGEPRAGGGCVPGMDTARSGQLRCALAAALADAERAEEAETKIRSCMRTGPCSETRLWPRGTHNVRWTLRQDAELPIRPTGRHWRCRPMHFGCWAMRVIGNCSTTPISCVPDSSTRPQAGRILWRIWQIFGQPWSGSIPS